MSQAATATEPVDDAGGQVLSAEQRARAIGWRDRHEFPNGAPDNWVDAEAFLKRGETEIPLMRKQLQKLERENSRFRRQQEETAGLVVSMTETLRKADERAMAKARKELEAERTKAIERGDVLAVHAADKELEGLRETPKPTTAATSAAAAPTIAPEVLAFANKHKEWWAVDQEMTQRADAIHRGVLAEQPDLTLGQNLEEVERRLAKVYPDRFENVRRRAPPAVSASSDGNPPPQPGTRGRRFDDMPRDVQKQFERYAKMLQGKGKPLTKEEWAENYWSQFQEA